MKKITTLLSALMISAIGFQSQAQITTFPYLEDFETGAGGWAVTGGLWALGTPAAPIINSAASGTNAWVTNLTGNYATNEDAQVVSPVFDFTFLGSPTITANIWYDSEFSWDGTVLQSSVDGGTSWQNVGADGDPNNWYTDNTIAGNPGGQQEGWTGTGTAGTNMWVSATHALDGLAGESSVLLRFAFGSDGSVVDEGFGFDDVNVTGIAITCPQPNTLTATSVTASAANLGWTEANTATLWDVEFGAAGFTPTGTPTNAGLTATTLTVTTLAGQTSYDFYVRADCGGGDQSTWSGPYSFTTPCAAVTLPFNEDFENAGAIPNCWTMAGGENWLFNLTGPNHVGNGGTITGNSVSDNYYATVDASGSDAPATLTSVPVDLSTLLNPKLTFYEISDNEGSANSVLDVEVYDGAVWNLVATFDSNTVAGAWEKKEIVLDALTFTGPAQVRFTFSEAVPADFDDDIAIDDVTFEEGPCPTPTLGVATSITATSADLGWTGNGTTWDIEYDTTGFTPTGTPTVVGTTTNPHSLTGLTDNTSYDFYVRTDCGGGDLSGWAGPFSFMTNIVGVNENASNNGVSIFPNPNNGIFTLEVNADDASVKVMNTQGQIILTKNILTNNAKIDLSNNAKGIYFVTVTSENGVSTQKVIVQ